MMNRNKDQLIVLVARLKSLGKMIITMPEMYVFLLVLILMWLPGFRPLPFLTVEGGVWFRGILNGLFLAWTFLFIGFVQREESYKGLHSQDMTVQGLDVEGNKHWTMYILAVLVWLLVYCIELIVTEMATTWFFLVCAFVQILPLLIGDSLREQAKHLIPLIAKLTVIATGSWMIAWGTI